MFQNKGNPTALLMSGLMMLRHLELKSHADKIENAVLETLKVFQNSKHFLPAPFTLRSGPDQVISSKQKPEIN